MNRSYSKIRHIQESNQRLENRLLNEQSPTAEERYVKAGYKEVTKINLPDGTYIGNPDGSETTNSQENLNYVGDIHIYNNNQRTGYLINKPSPSRSGYENAEINLKGGNQNTFEGKVYFKDVGYKPTPQQSTTNQEQTKTITNKVASEGLKNVTTQMVDGPPFKGMYSGYEFGGVFNGINYEWNCNGVEGMSGVRGMVDGQIISGNNSHFQKPLDGKITDAIPNGVWVGFYGNDKHGFILYVTTSNKPKVSNF